MSIQTIPRDERDQFGSNLGSAISGAFNQSFQGGLEKQYAEVQKQQEQGRLRAALGEAEKLYNDTKKTTAEKRIGLTQVLQNYPQHAKQLIDPLNEQELQEQKGQQALAVQNAKPPKSPPIGTVPTNPEVVNKINKIKADNPNASADQLLSAFEEAQISPHDYNQHVINARANEKNETKKNQTQVNQDIKIHEMSDVSDKKINTQAEAAEKTLLAIHDARNALKKTPTGPLSVQNILGKTLKGTPFEFLGLTPEGAIIESTIPTFLEGMKDLFGVRLSDADLALLRGKLIDIGKTPEANEAILSWAEKNAKYAVRKAEIAREIKKENKGWRKIDFDDAVKERFDAKYGKQIDKDFVDTFMGDKVPMRFPDGKVINVSKDKYEAAVKAEAKRL